MWRRPDMVIRDRVVIVRIEGLQLSGTAQERPTTFRHSSGMTLPHRRRLARRGDLAD